MRVRRKSWAPEVLQASKEKGLYIEGPELLKGQWKQLGNHEHVVLEIGSGKGDYWLNLHLNDPNTLMIGMERVVDVGAIALKKALEQDLGLNHRFLIDDAESLPLFFEEGELSKIHLNFSDPWPKAAHHKRRLTYPTMLDRYYLLLKGNGEIIFKTDNEQFYRESLEYFQPSQWLLVYQNEDFRAEEQSDPITEYERRFMKKKQPIYRAIWRKKNV